MRAASRVLLIVLAVAASASSHAIDRALVIDNITDGVQIAGDFDFPPTNTTDAIQVDDLHQLVARTVANRLIAHEAIFTMEHGVASVELWEALRDNDTLEVKVQELDIPAGPNALRLELTLIDARIVAIETSWDANGEITERIRISYTRLTLTSSSGAATVVF